MVPPTGDGGSPAPIDRQILDYLRERLETSAQVADATITDGDDHLELRVRLSSAYYPTDIDEATLHVRWYTNDDCKIHYREVHQDSEWECRWDRHPNPHNSRDHFHPPPQASTPGEDADWPADYREMLTVVLDEIEARIEEHWSA
jgi:hypothetical protein